MFSEFNSLLFYAFAFSGSAYLLGFARQNQRPNTFFYNLIIFFAFFIPVFIAGYRSCGTDTMRYIYNYVKYVDLSWAEVFDKINGIGESGHMILTKILSYFTHARIYLAAYAVITVGLVYSVTTKIKQDTVAMTMLIFYFVFFSSSLNIMRQYIAIAIVAYSFKFIFDKNLPKFILTVLMATTFHTSAFLVLPLYFLWTKKEKPVSWVIIIPMLIALLVVGLNLESVLETISSYESESAAINRYTTYTELKESKNRDVYLNLLTAAITLFHFPRLNKADSKNSFLIILMLIGTILGVCGFVSPYAKRISLYFNIAEIWVLADIPKCYKDHHSIWTARILVITYAIARFTIIAYFLEQGAIIPYMWVLPGWAQV